jgi:hypothetical protein
MSIPPHSPLSINTPQDLDNHKKEILRRINALPNGGGLFMLNPLLLLADLQVELGKDLEVQILAKTPGLASLPSAPYAALKAAKSPQPGLRVRILGLFQ